MKEARAFREDAAAKKRAAARHAEFQTVEDGIQKWLDICEFEGRDGKDPVSPATIEGYKARASIMRAYEWEKPLHELEAPDMVAFRSWLLKNYSRDQAKKVLSSFHSVLLEMVTQGVLTHDPAAKITIQHSRYKEPVRIPSIEEVQLILDAADALAVHRNGSIAKAWKRYQAMIYLALDTGMRPQEYLALPTQDLLEKGVRVTQALDRSNKIGPPKSRAGRRYIPVGEGTLKLVRAYRDSTKIGDTSCFVFPGRYAEHQPYNKFLRRGWHKLMKAAGLMEKRMVDGRETLAPIYTPYSLRHFYASMLISQNKDLKTIQERMGHEDAAMTLNVYGHLIRQKHAEEIDDPGIISDIRSAAACGKSVAKV
ncbi:site-specific integrase [Novosphingobium endophyticum]|uniref:Site-specific integrase n=1 Tax=Novosphingobium endophyticum TaxID=1955250 RepID=A0A916TUU7_9SPHN|nr:site-specific integrase [Novosphingobium endophyticum]GGC12545.1 site-specific integrase [Novosphingobium endophyticum]